MWRPRCLRRERRIGGQPFAVDFSGSGHRQIRDDAEQGRNHFRRQYGAEPAELVRIESIVRAGREQVRHELQRGIVLFATTTASR